MFYNYENVCSSDFAVAFSAFEEQAEAEAAAAHNVKSSPRRDIDVLFTLAAQLQQKNERRGPQIPLLRLRSAVKTLILSLIRRRPHPPLCSEGPVAHKEKIWTKFELRKLSGLSKQILAAQAIFQQNSTGIFFSV